MKKPSIITLASLIANLVFLASLVHVYQTTSDLAFKAWVDQNLLSTFTLVLGGSVGAGSIFAYIFLRKKTSGLTVSGRLQRTGPQKQSPLTRPTGISSQARNVPIGPPPGPTSKHTAYAVPPLAKPPSQSSPRQSSSWSTAPRQWSPTAFRTQRQELPEAPNQGEQGYAAQQLDPQQFSQPVTRTPFNEPQFATPERQSSAFAKPPVAPPAPPTQSPVPDRPQLWAPQSGFQPGTDKTSTPQTRESSDPQSIPSYMRQPIGSPIDRPKGFGPSQSEVTTRPADSMQQTSTWDQRVNPAQSYPTPQKWLPPSASPVPRTAPPAGPLLRPSPQNEPRGNFGSAQGAPRPLGYAPPQRQPPPIGTSRYRPEEKRPGGLDNQQAPTGIPGKPFLNQRTPPPDNTQGQSPRQSQVTAAQQRQPEPPPDSLSSPSPVGEMDWDTALDAILKTLRKDKIADKP